MARVELSDGTAFEVPDEHAMDLGALADAAGLSRTARRGGGTSIPSVDLYSRPSSDESAALAGPAAPGTSTPATPAAPPAPPPTETYDVSPEERAAMEEIASADDGPGYTPSEAELAWLSDGAGGDHGGPGIPAVDIPALLARLAYHPENPAAPNTEDARLSAESALADANEAEARVRSGEILTPPTSVPAPGSASLHGTDYLAGAPPTVGSGPGGYPSAVVDELTRAATGGAPTVPGAVPAGAVVEMPGRTVSLPGRTAPRSTSGGGARTVEAAPEMTPGEAAVDLLTDRPFDAAPLYPEPHETPTDRALALNERRRVLEARRAEAAATGYAEEGDALRGAEEARQAFETERRAAMTAGIERYRNAVDRASAMTLDPEGWYHDRGAIGTIAAAIAIGMGSMGSSITGGPNQALSIINDSISRDLEAQNQRIDSAWRTTDADANLLDMMVREFDSRGAAIEASRAAMLNDVANRVAETSAGLEGTEAGIHAAELHESIINEAAAAQAAAESAAFEDEWARRRTVAETLSAEAEATRDMRRAAGGGGGRASALTEANQNVYNRARESGYSHEEAAGMAGFDPAAVREPAGGRFAESSANDNAGTVSALSSSLDEMERLMGPAGEGISGVGLDSWAPDAFLAAYSDEGVDLRGEIENAVDLIARLRSGAAITDNEAARFERILRGANTDRALRVGVARIRREIAARTTRNPEGRSRESVIDDTAAAHGLTETTP